MPNALTESLFENACKDRQSKRSKHDAFGLRTQNTRGATSLRNLAKGIAAVGEEKAARARPVPSGQARILGAGTGKTRDVFRSELKK